MTAPATPATARATVPLPAGFHVALDPGVRILSDRLWLSTGAAARLIRLSERGSAVWRRLRAAPVDDAATGALARRLTDAGVVHPLPPHDYPGAGLDLTVVVPVRDRADMLAGCLAALGGAYPVVVVDDGSADPAAVAAVADRAGAMLLRHPVNTGPAAARNTGLAAADTEFVAFVDSDCVPGDDWIARLAPHFADPLVAAAAPRITGWSDLGAVRRCGLDLGSRPARVAPGGAVAFVPTAALVVRRRALGDIGDGDAVFDPALRVGEDVDMVWRLHRAGWRVRYEPSVRVAHHEPSSTWARAVRRFRYGTSAAPLAQRHPGTVAHLIVHPLAGAAAAAALTRKPAVCALALAGYALATARPLHAAGVPAAAAARFTASALARSWLGIGRYSTRFAVPALALAAVRGGGRRAAAVALLLGPAAVSYLADGYGDPVSFIAAEVADDIAYGCGVVAGCVRHRTTAPLRPVFPLPRLGRGMFHLPRLGRQRRTGTTQSSTTRSVS